MPAHKIYILKKALVILLIVQAAAFTAKAQLGYNYAQYSIGFGSSYVKAKTDVPYPVSHPAYYLNTSYNLSPYINFTLQYEFGRLSGGFSDYYVNGLKKLNPRDTNYSKNVLALSTTYLAADPYGRSYYNDYQSIHLHADVQLGELLDLNEDHIYTKALKNIYVGTGIGMVYNNISAINRLSADSSYSYGGSDHSTNVLIPVRIGYQFKIYNSYDEPSILVDLGYQMNYVFGFGLDGYSDPLFTTRSYERFGGFHIGVKFNFGNVISYRKALH